MLITPARLVDVESIRMLDPLRRGFEPLSSAPGAPINNQGTQEDITNNKADVPSARLAPYTVSKISTQGFLELKANIKDPFAILDQVIEKMHKNIEELGDALESMAKLAEKSSKQALGLKILEKMLEAIDEMNGESRKK